MTNEAGINSKIVFYLQNDLLGGAEQLLRLLALNYCIEGEKVKIVILLEQKSNNWINLHENMEITYLNAKNYFPGIFKLTYYLMKYREFEYHQVYSSNININGVLGLFRKINILNVNQLIIRETTLVFLRTKGLKRFFHVLKYILGYDGADLVICQTDIMKNQFLDNLKISRKWNLKVINNPLDYESIIRFSNEESEVVSNLKSIGYIISAGRFIPEKGFDLLIKAYKNIKHLTDFKLVIIGDGKLRGYYEELIAEYDLKNDVILPGFQNNPFIFFKYAEVCVVSSRVEGFPNVLLQMSSLNGKVASTLCAGGVEDIPGVLTCKADSIDELSEILKKTITINLSEEILDKKKEYLKNRSIDAFISQVNQAVK